MIIKHALPWIVAIIIVTSGVFYLGWEEVASALGKTNPLFMGTLFFLQLLTLALIAYRWQYLINKNNQKISFGKVFAINMAGNYIESVTPSVKLGGEAAKVYLLRSHTGNSYSNLAGIMLTIKYFSLMPFIILTGFSLGFASLRYQLPAITILAFLFLVAFFLLIAWIHHRSGKSKGSTNIGSHGNTISCHKEESNYLFHRACLIARNIYETIANFVQKASKYSRNVATGKDKVLLLIISSLIWLLYPAKVYLVTHMLEINIDVVTVAIITFTAYLIGLLPILPGGLGIFEGGMVFMFVLVGFEPTEGLAVTLLSRLVTYWFPLLVSAVAAAILTLTKPDPVPSRAASPFFSTTQKIENLTNRWEPAFHIYFRLFYEKKLKREVDMANLAPGDSVLQIGCGPSPYTAIFLAKCGLNVTALDYHEEAAQKAQSLVRKRKMEDVITIVCADGSNVECSEYDAVWVSLNVSSKAKVVNHAFLSLKEGGVLIYRNVPKWLSSRFTSIPPTAKAFAAYHKEKHVFWLGAESVMVKKKTLQDAANYKDCLITKSRSRLYKKPVPDLKAPELDQNETMS